MTESNNSIKESIFSRIPLSAKHKLDKLTELRNLEVALLDNDNKNRDTLFSDQLSTAFIKRIETGLVLGTTCELLASAKCIPIALSSFLDKHSLPQRVALQQSAFLLPLNWNGIDISEDVVNEESVSVCLADYGIAETASVVIRSAPDMPILLSFLASYQIIILKRSNILAYLEDYGHLNAQLVAQNKTPRNTSFITGCSGTTDIEGVLVQGAHGPKLVHIFIIDQE